MASISRIKVEKMDVDDDTRGQTYAPKHSTTPTISKLTFTIDDIPRPKWPKWPKWFQEFHAWLEIMRLSKESHYTILMEFVSIFTKALRNLWNTI